MKSLQIINKIESKKVELGMNVELAVVDDIKKLMATAVNNKNIYDGDAMKAVSAIQKAKSTALDWRENLQDAQKKIIELTTAAKGLGIEIPKEILNYQEIVSKGVKDSAAIATKLNDLQMQIPLNK